MIAYTHFKCNQCGSDLDYAIGMNSLRCVSCGEVDPIESSLLDSYLAHDYKATISTVDFGSPELIRHELKCENCGASFMLPNNVHAEECPYCDLNVVVPVDLSRKLKPDGIIPFEIHQESAELAFKQWIAGLWFAPSALKRKAIQVHPIVGSYIPMWAFDAQVYSSYSGQRGDKYVTRRNDKTVVKIRWRRKSGNVYNSFDDVITMGTTTLPVKFQSFLSDWDLFKTQHYNEKYLSGFRSELYQIALPEAYLMAKEVMYRSIRNTVKRDIGGDYQRISHINSDYQEVGFKLLLAPMWISAFSFKQKTYRYVINGQNGKAHGERPWSVFKIIGAAVLIGLIVGAIYLYSQ